MTISLYNLPGVEHTYGSLTANCDCAINKAARKYKRWTTVVMFLHILPSTCPRRHTGHCESGRDTLVTASMGATHRSLRVWVRHTGHCESGRDTQVTASLGATPWSMRVWEKYGLPSYLGYRETRKTSFVNATTFIRGSQGLCRYIDLAYTPLSKCSPVDWPAVRSRQFLIEINPEEMRNVRYNLPQSRCIDIT